MSRNLTAALEYAARGWRVLPVRPREKIPYLKAWTRAATCVPDVIEHWWAQWPDAGVGIATGAESGILVLDQDGPEGRALLADLVAHLGPLPETLSVSTGREDGGHLYWHHWPGPKNRAAPLGTGLDIRTDGGYVLAPPSIHPSGREYTWATGGAVSEAPGWLREILTGNKHAAANKRLQAAVDAVARSTEPGRNDLLNSETFKLYSIGRDFPYLAGAVRRRMAEAGVRCGLEPLEVERTVASAMSGWSRADVQAVRVAVPGGPGWLDGLHYSEGKDGVRKLIRSAANVHRILRGDPAMSGLFAWDELARKLVKTKEAPWGASGDVVDADMVHLQFWIAEKYWIEPTITMLFEQVQAVGLEHRFHPVRRYLDGLRWDGRERLDQWLWTYIGAEQTVYSAEVGARFLVGAVARAYEPGSKMDTMLILEGRQGIGKSTSMAALFGRQWVSDTSRDISDPDFYTCLHGSWAIEMAELAALRKGDIERIKAIISSQSDRYRPKYGRVSVDVPRSCVFFGTTNESTYLLDSENRRFWPVSIKDKMDRDGIERDRDQLWAEAVVRYRDGYGWVLGLAAAAAAGIEADDRILEDAWESLILSYLSGYPDSEVSLVDVMANALDIPNERMAGWAANRCAKIMRTLGWARRRSSSRKFWVKVKS